jgi:TonB family protein
MPALSLPNLLTYVVQATAVVAAGALAARALRLTDPRARIALWRLLLVLCLALPFVAPVPATRQRPAAPPAFAHATDAAAGGDLASVAVASAQRVARALPEVPAFTVGALLAAGAVSRLAWLAAGVWSLRRLRRTAFAPRESAAFAWAAARVGVSAAVRVSPAVSQPATFGVLRPVVVVPPAFESWPAGIQRALAAHELLHVKRRDWAQAVAEELARAALWFHPAAWWLVDRIRLAREQIVDREVVRLTGDRQAYLEALVDLASSGASALPVPASAFFRRPHLLERVVHLTREVPMARLRFVISLAAVGTAVLATTMVAARALPLDAAQAPAVAAGAAPQPIDMDAVRRAQPPAPVSRVHVVYPEAARAAGVEGPVVLQVSTDAGGTPTGVEVLLGAPELTDAAVAALWQWRFEAPGEPRTFVLGVNVRPEPEPGPSLEGRRIDDTVRPPKKTLDVRPVYPREAKDAGVQGVVIIEARIAVDGRVSEGRVLRQVDPRLDAAALDAVLRWQYTPTLVDGSAVPVLMTITVNFALA